MAASHGRAAPSRRASGITPVATGRSARSGGGARGRPRGPRRVAPPRSRARATWRSSSRRRECARSRPRPSVGRGASDVRGVVGAVHARRRPRGARVHRPRAGAPGRAPGTVPGAAAGRAVRAHDQRLGGSRARLGEPNLRDDGLDGSHPRPSYTRPVTRARRCSPSWPCCSSCTGRWPIPASTSPRPSPAGADVLLFSAAILGLAFAVPAFAGLLGWAWRVPGVTRRRCGSCPEQLLEHPRGRPPDEDGPSSHSFSARRSPVRACWRSRP